MDEDESNLNNYEVGSSKISFPLSPELSTKRTKKRKRSLNVSFLESNSIISENARAHKESSGNESLSDSRRNFENDKEPSTSERRALVASTAFEMLLKNDFYTTPKLIDNHDKTLKCELPCFNNYTTPVVDSSKGQDDNTKMMEKSPILKTYKKPSSRFKKKILNDLGESDKCKSDKLHSPSESNLLTHEYNDISFSVLEEICQTTELSFDCDKANSESSIHNNSCSNKTNSVLCGKVSSNCKSEKKNTACDKVMNISSNKLIEIGNNCKNKIKILDEKRKRCGSIYVNNSRRNNEPNINSGSIETLLESTKLLDNAETVTYLKETKKQKEFKLICKKEKLNDGRYLNFENISKIDKKIDKHLKKTAKDSKRYENGISCDNSSPCNNSSLMEKYNIDMNNTLNFSSEQLDDLIANAEISNFGKETTNSITSSGGMNCRRSNKFHENPLIPINNSSDLETLVGSSGSLLNKMCDKKSINSMISNTAFQQLKSEKSQSLEKLINNSNLPLKLSKAVGSKNCPRNGQTYPGTPTKIESASHSRIDKNSINFKNIIPIRRKINNDVLHSNLNEISENRFCALLSTSEKHNLENEFCNDVFGGFSTISGKATSEPEKTFTKTILISEKEICDDVTHSSSTDNRKLLTVTEDDLIEARTLLSENEPTELLSASTITKVADSENAPLEEEIILNIKENYCLQFNEFSSKQDESALIDARELLTEKECHNTVFSGFSTAKGISISVSEEAIASARTLLSDNETCDTVINAFSTAAGKPISALDEAKGRTLLSDKEPCDTAFSGFSTAKGKSISVSDKALARARTLLSDNEPCDTAINAFSTATGKSISVSEEALAKGRTLLSEKETLNTAFSGFSTANGKSISVSEEALAKARTLLSDDDTCDRSVSAFSTASGKQISALDEAKGRTLLSDKEPCDTAFSGFSTAKGKSISVSDKALARARTLLSDNEPCDTAINAFSTATGKSISVSEEVVAKGRTLLSEIEPLNTAFSGFSTAKGKSISVSEEALARARTLLSDNEPCDTAFSGFSTASGNLISVSEEALVQARTLLSEKESEDLKFDRFATAKGKSISVSNEALVKAKTSLSEKESYNTVFSGFSTATGKSISVSEEALVKARTLLDKDPCDTSFHGFTTATGSLISVSDEALANARTLLSEKDPCDTAFSGFSTATGKSITVSEEALAEARTLLSEKESEDLKFGRFATATGKSSSISNEALAGARYLLCKNETSNDILNTNMKFVTDIAPSKISPLFSGKESDGITRGFSTAKGKSILVSEKALVHARKKIIDESPSYSENFNVKEACALASDVLVENVNSKALSQKSKYLFFHISDMNKDESVKNSHDCKDENGYCGLPVIEEEPCLQDDNIDHENHKSQSTLNSSNQQSQFYEDMPCLSLSFVDEVSESTAAFLADEDISECHNPPVWLRTFVTSPSMIQDRSDALSPILCSDNDVKMRKKRACSPILDHGDRFKKRKKRLTFSKSKYDNKQVAECSTPVSHSKMRNPEDHFNNFFSNLKTSTPISVNRTRSKRVIKVDEENVIDEKKLKLMDSWDDSQVDQTIFYQLDVIEGRRKAAEKQELFLKTGKNKSLTNMRKGSLFVKKQQESRISLKSLVRLPRRLISPSELAEKGIKQSVIGVTYKNAADFRFSSSNSLSNEICEINSDGVAVGDDALVILSDDGSAGLKEISRAFLASPGVDPVLISQEWIANHYRSIVWKLAATERSVPHLLSGIYLTLDNVLLQLKYRYDREIDECQRSCLRKILETDESAARRMVVCVSEISAKQSSVIRDVRLTDGWYGISASCDEEMMCLIEKGKVKVGTKLVVQGCELMNCEQGYDPLQVPDTVKLKVHTNCARRAKWDSRLGFCQIQGSILVRLRDILPKGGNIGRVDVLVVRVYPVVYLFKTEDGKTVVYSRKREEQECLLNERKMTELMEKLQSQVQHEMDEIDSCKPNSILRSAIDNQYDEPLSTQDLVDSDRIPTKEQMRIIANLREQEQRKYQETLRRKLDEKMSESGLGKRSSIPMLKVRVIDSRQPKNDMSLPLNTAVLTVWKPTEDVENVLAEGNVISLYNIAAQGKRNGELQLSTGRQTKYSIISKSEAFSRECHFLSDITYSLKPLFSEINTVGLVVHVDYSSSSVDTAYLTDHECNFLGVRFWGGIKKFGWQSCICVGSEISCSNLDWRSNAFKYNVPYVFVTELSVFSSNPRSRYLQKALDQLKVSLTGIDLDEFVSNSKEKLLDILNGGGMSTYTRNLSTENCSASGEANKASNHSHTSTSYAINPSNLITESPMSSVKSKMLLEKMQRLHGYKNPPTITVMPNLQVSPALKKDFKTPNKETFQ